MRLVTIGAVAAAVLLAALFYLSFLDRSPAHLAALVPQEMRWGIFYRSIDDLRQAYAGPYARHDVDCARLRLGEPINAPDFEGVLQQTPIGSYRDRDGEEIFLVPFFDLDAYEKAFETNRENVLLRPPHRAAANYVSVSTSPGRASRGDDNPLVLRALQYPVSAAGRPADGRALRSMLFDLLSRESRREPPGIVPLWREVARLPDAVGDPIAAACADLVVGVVPATSPTVVPHVEFDARAAPDGLLARAGPVAREVDLHSCLRALPVQTVLFCGAAFDARGWSEVGLPWDLGDAACVAAIIHSRHRARFNSLLVVIRPREPARLEAIDARALLGAPPPPCTFSEVTVDDLTLRTAKLDAPPAWLETLLASDQRDPPPVYLSTASAGGFWYAAVGAWAEDVVRKAIDCQRGRTELSIEADRTIPFPERLFRAGHTAAAMTTVEGLKALAYPMPYVDLASIGQPISATLVVDVAGDKVKGELRVAR